MTDIRGKRTLRLSLAFLLALASTRGATAATFTVTSLADSGPGSLRQAVLDANAAAGADEVAFAPGLTGTITLTSGEILITDSLVVHGPGAGVLTVSGNDHSRIFHIENFGPAEPIDVTLSALTLTRGNSLLSQDSHAGGAVFVLHENLTILDCVISDSTSGYPFDPETPGCGGNVGFTGSTREILRIADSTLTGGTGVGISDSSGGNLCITNGQLLLERSTLSGGAAHIGGGLFVDTLAENSRIYLSTISDNQGYLFGGGIQSYFLGTLTIESSTISGNTATQTGGGLYVISGNLRIINSTISGNNTPGIGGGIYFSEGPSGSGGSNSSLLLRLTTVSNNTAAVKGGSILVGDPANQIELDHSIVANGAPQDLASRPFATFPATLTANYSLIEAPGDSVLVGANNHLGADPLVGPLAGNGGPTLTHRLLSGSPAIDAGNPAIPTPPATDQRGFARIFGPAIDLGSVEAGGGGIVEVPALSQVGLLVLALLLFTVSVQRLRRDRPE